MVTRRTFLTGSAAAILAACGSDIEPEVTGRARSSDRFVPVAAVITRWGQDPFAFGSYSYLAPGATPADRAALGAPVGERLFFAGEATSLDHPATVHGALLSGRAAADAIANHAAANESVVVIGAGAAGLGAARFLVDAGYAVTLIEGRDRIGGRVHNDTSMGVSTEVGAGWIHGVDGNPLTELADRFAVERRATDADSMIVYDTNGEAVDDDRVAAIEELISTLDVAGATTVGEALDAAILEVDDADARLARYMATSVFEHEFAADVDALSPQALIEGEPFGGDDAIVPGGYIDLLAPLAEGVDVRLSQKVVRIGHDTGGVEIRLEDENDDNDETVLRADRVLVTVPLGVLKAGVIAFEPELPQDKLRAIERLGMGVLDRVTLAFSEVFWDDDVEVIGAIGDEPGLFIEWVDWERISGKPILVGFNAGSVAERIEAMADDEIVTLAVATLERIYG